MITLPIWAAIALAFVLGLACFLLGVALMSCFAIAGEADDRIARREGDNE